MLMVALLALAPAAADARQDDGRAGPRIVNGQDASPGEYPYQVFIFIDPSPAPGDEGFCGGSIVGLRQVLTAAHCATNTAGQPLSPGAFEICAGLTDLDGNDNGIFDACPAANAYDVVQNDVHPQYGDRGQIAFGAASHDVAMLTTASADGLLNGANMAVIRVVDGNETALVQPGVNATITGWGTTSQGGDPPMNGVLQEADVPIVSDATCAAHYTNFGAPSPPAPEPYDPPTMICAGNEPPPRQDTCQGDSGGPLRVTTGGGEPVLIGDTSWGQGCAQQDREGVYGDLQQPEMNAFVHDRIPRASLAPTGTPTAGQPTTFNATSTPAGYFNSHVYDLDNDGAFDDGSGSSATFTFPTAGTYVVRIQSSEPTGDTKVGQATITVVTPPPPGPGGTGNDTTPPGVSVRFARVAFLRALARGLRARVRCSERCRVTIVILIPRSLARRLRIPRQVAIGRLGFGAGTRTIVIRFTRRAKRRLRRVRRATFVIRTTAVDPAGNRRTVTSRARLTR
jgi:trypsin